jgi:hypothetical protein
MARRYARAASKTVKSAVSRRKRSTLRSAKKVKSRKPSTAMGMSEARRKRKKVVRRGTR